MEQSHPNTHVCAQSPHSLQSVCPPHMTPACSVCRAGVGDKRPACVSENCNPWAQLYVVTQTVKRQVIGKEDRDGRVWHKEQTSRPWDFTTPPPVHCAVALSLWPLVFDKGVWSQGPSLQISTISDYQVWFPFLPFCSPHFLDV